MLGVNMAYRMTSAVPQDSLGEVILDFPGWGRGIGVVVSLSPDPCPAPPLLSEVLPLGRAVRKPLPEGPAQGRQPIRTQAEGQGWAGPIQGGSQAQSKQS